MIFAQSRLNITTKVEIAHSKKPPAATVPYKMLIDTGKIMDMSSLHYKIQNNMPK